MNDGQIFNLKPSDVEMQPVAEGASPPEASPPTPTHQRPMTPAPKALSKATKMANLHEVFKAANEANMRILGAIPKVTIPPPPPPPPSSAEPGPAAAGSPFTVEPGLAAAGNPELESVPLPKATGSAPGGRPEAAADLSKLEGNTASESGNPSHAAPRRVEVQRLPTEARHPQEPRPPLVATEALLHGAPPEATQGGPKGHTNQHPQRRARLTAQPLRRRGTT
jgi:hypothetical protein